MKDETIKDTIFKKGIKAIPNFIWVLCASYALIMGTNVVVLKFSDIDANKHINRYFDIILSRQEAKSIPNEDIEILYTLIAKNNQEILELKKNSHPPIK